MRYYFSILLFISCISLTSGQARKSFKIKGVNYTVLFNADRSLVVLKGKRHQITRFSENQLYIQYESFSNFRCVDFNGDGYNDVIIEYFSNVPSREDLLLYNPSTDKFNLIKDFPDYPASARLPHTRLFYSYHRSGCADADWDSDLYKIVNFKIIKIGSIAGRECAETSADKGIFVYRVRGTKTKVIKRYNIDEPTNYKDYKWGFILDYWKRNYPIFVH